VQQRRRLVPAVWALRRRGKRVFCSLHVAREPVRSCMPAKHFHRGTPRSWTPTGRCSTSCNLAASGSVLDSADVRSSTAQVFRRWGLVVRARGVWLSGNQENALNGLLRPHPSTARRRAEPSCTSVCRRPGQQHRGQLPSELHVFAGPPRHLDRANAARGESVSGSDRRTAGSTTNAPPVCPRTLTASGYFLPSCRWICFR